LSKSTIAITRCQTWGFREALRIFQGLNAQETEMTILNSLYGVRIFNVNQATQPYALMLEIFGFGNGMAYYLMLGFKNRSFDSVWYI